jgi:TM2 domain-containing membrane protein YozV
MRLFICEQNMRKKSYLVSYLLLIFLGWIGAHRYYLGQWGSALLYTFTFGFLFIGVVVDLFLLPLLVREARQQAEQLSSGIVLEKVSHERPAWAEKKPFFLFRIGSFLSHLLIFIFFPMLIVFLGFVFELHEISILMLLVLFLTGVLGANSKSIAGLDQLLAQPGLARVPILPEMIAAYRNFYLFYCQHKPRPAWFYLFYPLTAPLVLIFSKTARQEWARFQSFFLIILAIVILETVLNFHERFAPYLTIFQAFELIAIAFIVTLLFIIVFLLPVITSSFYLNLSGQQQSLRLLSIFGLLFAAIVAYNLIQKSDISMPAKGRLEAKISVEAFQKDVLKTAEMFIRYHAGRLSRDEPIGVSEPLSAEFRNLLEHRLVPQETKPFFVEILEDNNRRALVVGFILEDVGKHWLLVTDDVGLYRRWDELPMRWQQQARSRQVTHFSFTPLP